MKMSVFATYPDPVSVATAAVVPIRRSEDPFEKLVAFARSLVTDAVGDSSRRIYAHALGSFLSWAAEDGRPFTKTTVYAYKAYLEAKGLAPATINLRLSAV